MRRHELEVTDINQIIEILDQSKYLHLGLADDGVPYVIPMNYGYVMEDGKLTIYVHGATQGYKLDLIRKNSACCVTMECEVKLHESDVACNYSNAYSCLIGRGHAVILEDVEEKKTALSILMKTQTGKDFEFNDKQASSVCVIRIDVDEYTAKHHK